jgi:hypothetical protein
VKNEALGTDYDTPVRRAEKARSLLSTRG